MTLPPVMRIFFAFDLPLTVKAKLAKYINTLKKASKTSAIRWTKPENLHITLQFLAEVRTEHMGGLIAEVRAKMEGGIKNLTLSLEALQVFPTPYRPRVIVLGVRPQEELALLSAAIGSGIQAANYVVENRPFRGHLTLGRIKHLNGVNLGFLSTSSLPTIENIAMSEVILFRSEPQAGGSHYTIMERFHLG